MHLLMLVLVLVLVLELVLLLLLLLLLLLRAASHVAGEHLTAAVLLHQKHFVGVTFAAVGRAIHAR